jgi:uncharacterized protein YegJ (DUF2314 family)
MLPHRASGGKGLRSGPVLAALAIQETIDRAAMTDYPEQYAPFVDDHGIAPSTIEAYLPAFCAEPDIEELLDRFAALDRVTDISEILENPAAGDASFEFVWGHGETALEFRLEVQRTGALDLVGTFGLTAEQYAAADGSQWCISLTTQFGIHVLADFHTQIKALHIAAPEAALIYDCGAFRARSGNWLAEAATTRVSPPPDSLYTIHVVSDPADGATWFHSHGLLRCGCIELEMLDIPGDATSTFSNLFNVAAALFIEHGTPPPGEVFDVGHDLPLYWLPWEHAIQRLPGDGIGRGPDREDHHHPAGVLFAHRVVATRPQSTRDTDRGTDRGADQGIGAERPPNNVTILREILEDEPILFHTQMETQRMSLLAKEHFPRFRAIQRRFAENDEWAFHVKLGYQVDDCPDDADDNEHLWFDLHEISRGELEATLLNEPYSIARMAAGDRDRHAVDQLSDWSIECPYGLFDATSIGRLEELVRSS